MRHSILPNLYLAQTAVMLSGARRVALLLLLTLLTTATAWADNVTLSVDNSIAEGTAGHYFVNMPKTDTKTLTLSVADITTNGKGVFKVYDDGGKSGDYSAKCNGILVLTAPAGYVLQLSGNITTENSTWEYLNVYDNSAASGTKLLHDVCSTSDGSPTAITTVASSGQSMTLHFHSDSQSQYAGLDLTVKVVNPNAIHNITVNNATGGSVAATVGGTSASTAKFNNVVTLTATPSTGYVLSGISVTDGSSNAVDIDWSIWANTATFTMPPSAVTVTPTFTNKLTSLSVNMPKMGTKTVTIPVGVKSFNVYDDGGSTGNYSNDCSGTLTLTAPTGYLLQLSGNITAEATYDKLIVFDGSTTSGTILLGPMTSHISGSKDNITTVVSSGQSMTLNFYSNEKNNYPGLDLTVTLVHIPWSGSGDTADDPYIINNKEQLDLLAYLVNGTHGETRQPDGYKGKYFQLAANITYDHSTLGDTDSNYEAIGMEYNNQSFKGHFDGQGHTISGIRIYRSGNASADKYQGLFGHICGANAEVKNVILADAIITGHRITGSIVGYNDLGTVADCHVLSNVTVHTVYNKVDNHGGIAGMSSGTITRCTSAAALTDAITTDTYKPYTVGGIVGMSGGTVSDCIYLGTTLDGKKSVGAIVGDFSGSTTTVTNNYYTATNIQGKDNNGNVLDNALSAVGYNSGGAVTNCGLAHTITLGTGVTLGGTVTEHGRLTTYGTTYINFALAYNNGTSTTIYSTEGNEITLGNYSGTAPEGYTFGGYTVMDADNGDVTVTKTSGVYTFTMPAKNVTVSTNFVPDIATYWHADADHDGSTEAKPYIISTTTGLNLLAAQVNSGNLYIGMYFKLGANIEYDKSKENNFTPIGNNDYGFYGTFDGDGNSISGININIDIPSNDAQYQGIFGRLNGTVKNLVVSSSSIAARRMIGAIAGHFQGGTIKNCHVGNDVTLSGLLYVGGIVGNSEKGTIKGCTCGATITGAKYKSTLTHFLGGIVGATLESQYSSTLTDNIFTGAINGNLDDNIGAIVGGNDNGTLTNNVYISTGFGGIGFAGDPNDLSTYPTTGADGAGVRKAVAISAANGVTLTPVGTATTNNLSGITTYADNSVMGYDNKLYACATEVAKLSIAYTVPSGYEFNKIDAGEGVTVTASGNAYTITMPASDVTVDVDFDVIEYTLQYNGIDQATFVNSNPTTYTVESDAITLVNPTRTGYTFAGWTGTGLDAATMTVTIAKGSTGAKSYTATWKKLLTNTDIKVSAIADQTYTGSAFTPSVTVKDGETDITDQCDVAYSDNTNAGTATVTITAKTTSTNYTGKTTATFKIVAKTVSTPTITLSATEYVYDGQAKEPAVSSVKVGDTVIPASEYTVAYENNTKAGTATVKIVDKDGGNYTVSGSTTFEIVLKGDANGDKKVDAADIVRLVKDKAPKSDIDAVVKIIMGE